MCFALQWRALFRHPNLQKWREHVVFCTFWLGNVLRATTACTFSTSQLPKVVRHWGVLYILTWKCASRHNGVHFFDTFSTSEPPKVVRDRQFLTLLTWKCASRHNGVHFFDIATSKSGPLLVCFVHFDFKMCFAPQRRALFRHLNFQKWSENGVFCTFWLPNVLRATTACTFSSHLASWLRTRRFSEPTFRPSGAPNHWKNTVFRDFPIFSHICIFFLLTLSLLIFFLLIFLFSLPLPCSAFHLSILSEVWLLNFLRLYIYIHTSSTAQGGGGSFKNRKPIGEVGCCESGMAERSHWLTERWLELCLLEWLQWLQWSPHPQLLDVVWCTATVVVVVA